MPATSFDFVLLTACGWVNRRQLAAIAYLREENRVLREQLGGKRPRFSDPQRRRLAEKGKAVGRKGARGTVQHLAERNHQGLGNELIMARPAAVNDNGNSQVRRRRRLIYVRGHWKYLYRAVDKVGDTIDFLLTAKRDTTAALRFLRRAIEGSAVPEKVNIDKSGANTAALHAYNAEAETTVEIRQCKYLNNIVEQDHRFVTQKMRAALGFKTFRTAAATIMGIELVHMIRKGQVRPLSHGSDAEQFYALAA